MSGRLLLSVLPGEMRVARVDAGDCLISLRVLRGDRPGAAGDLLLGRVAALDPGLNAAFVDIGLERPGLLPLGRNKTRPAEGAALAVRIARAPADDKGARLAFAGEITVPAGAVPPRLLVAGDDPLEHLRAEEQPPDEVLVDDLETFTQARRRLSDRPDLLDRIGMWRGEGPLFPPSLEADIEGLLQPFVPLPGGGNLLIEPVRTLTAIDVNAGTHGGKAGRRALEVNREAAIEVARQLRLRDLSGRILIDFLEMQGRSEREELAKLLRDRLAGDSEPVQVFPPRGALFEVTRRRSRPPLHELLSRRCGLGGGGWSRDPAALAFEVLRRLAALPPTAKPRLLVAPALAEALRGPAAAALAAVEARRGAPIAVTVEAGRGLDMPEIVIG